jgi:eukaryotic-like serine/threonine-protein kinase
MIPRRFAIASKEVSVQQFRQFVKANNRYKPDRDTEDALRRLSPDPDGPWIGASWYTAAAYCNWLSEQERLPKDEWCYQVNKNGLYAEGMTIPANVLERKGYRLPTEAEWEYACRAGTLTSSYYGVSVELLGKYAWYQATSKERTWPAGSLQPNDLGLFDMLGNVYEWCQDGKGANRPKQGTISIDLIRTDEAVLEHPIRMCRGGMFAQLARDIRSTHRAGDIPSLESIYNGFRLARTCN